MTNPYGCILGFLARNIPLEYNNNNIKHSGMVLIGQASTHQDCEIKIRIYLNNIISKCGPVCVSIWRPISTGQSVNIF
jgi:hypothetical protein